MPRFYKKNGFGGTGLDHLLSAKHPKLDNVPAMLDLYRQPGFDKSIRRVEYRTYTPFIKSFNCSDIVEFCINQVDSYFAMNETCLSIKAKIEKLTGAGAVHLSPNCGSFLFDSCTYSESSREIETVRDPGIISVVRAMLCYNEDDSKLMATSGWDYPTEGDIITLNAADNSFHMLIPLRHIFNLFNAYPMVTAGRQTIRLVRARNDRDCFMIEDADTTAKIVIDSMELKVKHIYPNDIIKEKLMKARAADMPIINPFRKWELDELPTITQSAKREVWAVKTSAAVEKPRYVIVFFQTDKRNDLSANTTH